MILDRRWLIPALAALLLLAAACGDDDDGAPAGTPNGGGATATTTTTSTPEATTTPEATATPEATSTPEATGEVHQAVIVNFTLPTLTIAVGDTIEWTNNDGLEHTSTGDGFAWDSGTLPSSGKFRHTFDTAGEFGYSCTIHPSMVGTITVE